jgi:hypothetical protein
VSKRIGTRTSTTRGLISGIGIPTLPFLEVLLGDLTVLHGLTIPNSRRRLDRGQMDDSLSGFMHEGNCKQPAVLPERPHLAIRGGMAGSNSPLVTQLASCQTRITWHSHP